MATPQTEPPTEQKGNATRTNKETEQGLLLSQKSPEPVLPGSKPSLDEPPTAMEATSKTGKISPKRKLPLGPRASRRKAVARRRVRQMGLELIVTEVPLTRTQLSVLSKGRSFVPGPPPQKTLLENLGSSMNRLKEQINKRFADSLLPGLENEELGTHKKRRIMPQQLPMKQRMSIPTKKLPGLETMVHCETMDVGERILEKCPSNMSKLERETLKDLAQNPDLVIKKADKDGALVVLKRESYIKMGEAHLKDTETYIPLNNPDKALETVKRQSKILVNRFFNLDNSEKGGGNRRSFLAGQRDALLEHNPIIPHWYVLPKTHKKKDPDTGLWPGRPVLSGCNAPTRPVDRLLTTYLTPLLDLLPERLQDTTAFLRKVSAFPRFPPGSIIFSFDIVSLYPSIPQEEASFVVANFYEKNFAYVKEKLKTDYNIIAPPPYLIKEGIDHVLQGTLLRFNEHFYNQGKGTAIGASVSVAIAEIFVHASIEGKRQKLDKQPSVFYRYIDDIFGIFTGTEAELIEYHQELNKIHPDLKFTVEYSNKELPFLDTLVYIDNEGKVQTTVYHKPSNTHQYLHFHSCHPPSLKRSLPYSQALRIKRIVSEPHKLEEALKDMVGFFTKRGYCKRTLGSALNRLKEVNRETLLERKERPGQNRLIFPMLYSPCLENVLNHSLKEIWEWVSENAEGTPWEKHFTGPHPMIAWRKGKTIADHLVRAQFPRPQRNNQH